jgi:prenyltransferase beta subunit
MKRRTLALVLVWTLPSAVFLAATASVYVAFRIAPPVRLEAAERAAVMAPLRAAVDGKPAPRCTLHRALAGPIAATVWSDGRPIARADAEGADLAAAVDAAAATLATQPGLAKLSADERVRARVQVDLVTGTAPLGGGNWVFDVLEVPGIGDMLAINSGVEGIGVTTRGQATLLLPHELVAQKLLAAKRPATGVTDFAMGVDLDRIRSTLKARSRYPGRVEELELYRFRTDTFVEAPLHSGPPLPLYRGIPPRPPLSRAALREAALAGGRYLVAHMAANGRYIYEHDLSTGRQTDPKSLSYSMPRHAGTTYFLAELYRITKAEWLREPIERAFAHLAELMANGRCATTLPDGTAIDCIMDRGEQTAALGSTALAVVALAEYQRATGDARYLATASKLAAFLLYMQRPDGSFRHSYDPKTRQADESKQELYYSGEAALALVRMHVVTKDARYAAASERALDWLVDWYDFFLGGFFYGEEHWTCIAAEASWPTLQKAKYRDFCHGYGTFLREQQAAVGEHPDEDDYAGAYGFTPFLAPYNTPAGSRSEAMISAYKLGVDHGTPDAQVRAQITAALAYALGQQIRPDSDFAAVGPALGGVPSSPIERSVRIDFVQHVCSAMIRASELADE